MPETHSIPNRFDKPCRACGQNVPAGAGLAKKIEWTKEGQQLQAWFTYCADEGPCNLRAAAQGKPARNGSQAQRTTTGPSGPYKGPNKYDGFCATCKAKVKAGEGYYENRQMQCFPCRAEATPDPGYAPPAQPAQDPTATYLPPDTSDMDDIPF